MSMTKQLLTFLLIFCMSSYTVFAQDDYGHATKELGNFLSLRAGAMIYASSKTDSSVWECKNIIDDMKGEQGVWRVISKKSSRYPKYPQWVIIELPSEEVISSMIFALDKLTGKYACAKDVTIEFSTDGPEEGYTRVAREIIQHNRSFQLISLPTMGVRWIRITVRSNWGNPYLMEMGRVYGYNDVAMDNYEYLLSQKGKLDLDNIYFEQGSAIIKQESYPVIEILALILKNNPDWNIKVEGHTDGDGSSSFNLKLSLRRAEAVLDALAISGVNRKRLDAIGLGESRKIVKNESSESDKAANRRVTITLERSNGKIEK